MPVQTNEHGEPIWLRLPSEEIEDLDEWAKSEKRSRAAQLSLIVQNVLRSRKQTSSKQKAKGKQE